MQHMLETNKAGIYFLVRICTLGLQIVFSTGEAVFARCLSSLKEERVGASKQLTGPSVKLTGDKKAFIDQISQVGHLF